MLFVYIRYRYVIETRKATYPAEDDAVTPVRLVMTCTLQQGKAGKVAKADRGMAKEKITVTLEMGDEGWSSDPYGDEVGETKFTDARLADLITMHVILAVNDTPPHPPEGVDGGGGGSASSSPTAARYVDGAPFNFTPMGVRSDFVWLSARTPHVGPQYVW